jgi:hypothetical protein
MSKWCPLYPPKADILQRNRHVRFVPKADVRRPYLHALIFERAALAEILDF